MDYLIIPSVRDRFLFPVWSSTHSRIFHSYRAVIITDVRLQILTYAQHLWPLSSKGSLTTTVTLGIRFSETRATHNFCRAFNSESVTESVMTCFIDLGLPRLEFEHPTFRLRGGPSNRLRHHHRRGRCGVNHFRISRQ